jgi:hypothetical protein
VAGVIASGLENVVKKNCEKQNVVLVWGCPCGRLARNRRGDIGAIYGEGDFRPILAPSL